MRTGRRLSLVALLAGLALIAWGVIRGEVSVHLVVVIPVVTGTGPIAALGMVATMGGLVGWGLTGLAPPSGDDRSARRADDARGARQLSDRAPGRVERETETRGGGVVLIGPIPIAWGSDRSSLLTVVVAAVVLMLVALGVMIYLGA